jgi:squalene-associated FAD-dependent desaturase
MTGKPRVVVVGGGLAGLAAALACADGGASVVVVEARRRLGGATWSAQRDGLWVDNGQHVFLRCCTAYREFLSRIGAGSLVTVQERLAIPVLSPTGQRAWLRRGRLPAPLHLAASLARYPFVAPGDRLRMAQAALRLARLDLADPALDGRTFGSWLEGCRQPASAVDALWNLIALPTLNLPAGEASLALAAKVFQTGLLTHRDAADIGWARVPLSRVHAEPAARSLHSAGAAVMLGVRVTEVVAGEQGTLSVHHDGRSLDAEAVVVAVPHEEVASLLPPEALPDPGCLRALGSSPIVNLHAVFDRPVTDLPFAAGVGTPVQWVFDRTAAAGLTAGQYLAVSLSGADTYISRSSEELRSEFLPALARLFPLIRSARLERFFVTREPAATFRQAPGTARLRPGPRTGVPGLFLAGAWTDTGWPATMEGAVRSGTAAAREALVAVGRTRRLPAGAVA